ncbi:ribonuclease H-like domain-containing protein [Tanacetum coccineum]
MEGSGINSKGMGLNVASQLIYLLFVICLVYLLFAVMAAVTINALDAGNPLFLQNNDHSNVPIIGFKLTGTENYKMWSTAMKIALVGKNKFGFVDGESSILEYYHKLNSLWREFETLTLLPACTCAAHEGVLKHKQLVRLMQFLMGINDVYQNIRSNILARDPLPDVKEAFNVVSRDKSYRGLHSRSGSSSGNKVQPAAFVFKSNNYKGNEFKKGNSNNNNSSNRGPNLNLLCKNCGLIGHTIERCYEIIRYPTGFKRNPNFPWQGMMKILSLINEKPTGNASANMAGMRPTFYNGNAMFNLNFEKFFSAQTCSYMYNLSVGWIINSGANQHFIVSTKNMFNVTDISGLNLTVGHPNGTLAKISTIGNLRLTSNVVLFDVLVIPKYNASLMSVHKLIKDSKLFVGFDETKGYIQDLNLVKTVRTGSEAAGLYLFDEDQTGKPTLGFSNFSFVCHTLNQLWHSRLGHPADQVLSILSKSIGFKYDKHVSPCDICHKAKQTRDPFPLSDHKSAALGDLVHLDLWGPYKVVSRDGYSHTSEIPYDDEREQSKDDGNAMANNNINSSQVVDEDATFATSLTENTNIPKGQHGTDASIPRIISNGLNSLTVGMNHRLKPKSLQEAILDKSWIEAMHNEMEALFKNKTWVLVDLPPNRKTIAKGFSQRNEIDYEETFSPVVKMVSVRCIISLAAHYNWPLFQLDVNNAFLYEYLHEDVYMDLPPGYYDPSETRVCKLVKSLYGLK